MSLFESFLACLRAAVDEDESLDHGWAAAGEAGEDVGAEADPEADAVREAVVVHDVLNLKEGETV